MLPTLKKGNFYLFKDSRRPGWEMLARYRGFYTFDILVEDGVYEAPGTRYVPGVLFYHHKVWLYEYDIRPVPVSDLPLWASCGCRGPLFEEVYEEALKNA